MAKKNLNKFLEGPREWFMKLSPTLRTLLTGIVFIMVMGIFLVIIPSSEFPTVATNETIETDDDSAFFEEVAKDFKEDYTEMMKDWDAFFVDTVEETEDPITIKNIMCSYLYQYNVTNSTWGETTCYKWENGELDCMCITPAE